jgi:hypothetical protein
MYRKILRFAIKCCEFLSRFCTNGGRRTQPPAAELLLRRYGQLERQHSSYNRIVHSTFYVSVVFVGILAGASQQFLGTYRGVFLFIFASGVFSAMLLWTRTYVNGRRSVAAQKAALKSALEATDYELWREASLNAYFPDEEPRDFWDSRACLKNGLLYSYYLLLILISIGAGLYTLTTL